MMVALGSVAFVAPRAGAWIETSSFSLAILIPDVAPRAGAWIETVFLTLIHRLPSSPLAQGRGLKPLTDTAS